MGISTLEKLNGHFHMIIAARSIKLSQVSFLSNFDKIEIKGLSRNEAVELITRGRRVMSGAPPTETLSSFSNLSSVSVVSPTSPPS